MQNFLHFEVRKNEIEYRHGRKHFMTHISKKRVRLIKVIVIGLFTLLLFLIVSILMWYGKIRFEWSDRIVVKYKYEKSKSKLKRILVLGDSQLEKWPMKHCLYKDIEKFCRKIY